MSRKLVTIRKIDSIVPIKGADRIEQINIGGWCIVSQKGQHTIGDFVIMFEVDSLLPIKEPYIDTFEPRGRKKTQLDDGTIVEGYRLRTIKLKGVVSQGFILPLSLFPDIDFSDKDKDYADILGVVKYETPETIQDIEANKEVVPKGTWNKYKWLFRKFLEAKFPKIFKRIKFKSDFPDFIKKTDQERVQNLSDAVWKTYGDGTRYQVSYKLDGSSLTVFREAKVEGACSRNLRKNPKQTTDAFIIEAKKVWEAMRKTNHKGNYTFQGEMVGPKIQENFEGMIKNQFYVYSMWDSITRIQRSPLEVEVLCTTYNIPHVPVLGYHSLQELFPGMTCKEDLVKAILKHADGPSGLQGKFREGFVYKALDIQFSFKAISNAYLLAKDKQEQEAEKSEA
jgi:hypothetical protein